VEILRNPKSKWKNFSISSIHQAPGPKSFLLGPGVDSLQIVDRVRLACRDALPSGGLGPAAILRGLKGGTSPNAFASSGRSCGARRAPARVRSYRLASQRPTSGSDGVHRANEYTGNCRSIRSESSPPAEKESLAELAPRAGRVVLLPLVPRSALGARRGAPSNLHYCNCRKPHRSRHCSSRHYCNRRCSSFRPNILHDARNAVGLRPDWPALPCPIGPHPLK
jgi:hypothetical protein